VCEALADRNYLRRIADIDLQPSVALRSAIVHDAGNVAVVYVDVFLDLSGQTGRPRSRHCFLECRNDRGPPLAAGRT